MHEESSPTPGAPSLLTVLALPLAAGTFAISHSVAVVVPVLCGAAWDSTGVPWAAFLPIGVCALTLTTLGIALTLRSQAR